MCALVHRQVTDTMNQISTMLVGTHEFRLVGLSILIAILASCVALDLAARVTAAGGRAR